VVDCTILATDRDSWRQVICQSTFSDLQAMKITGHGLDIDMDIQLDMDQGA